MNAIAAQEEELNWTLCLPLDYPLPELLALAPMLEAAGVLPSGFVPPPVGLCHPMGFLHARFVDKQSTITLPDRNIASRFAQIAKAAVATDEL